MEAPSEPRYITTDQTVQGLGLNILGGNATGIFVCDVKSPGYDLGIRVGDQILEVSIFSRLFLNLFCLKFYEICRLIYSLAMLKRFRYSFVTQLFTFQKLLGEAQPAPRVHHMGLRWRSGHSAHL